MTISELIHELTRIRDQRGDMETMVGYGEADAELSHLEVDPNGRRLWLWLASPLISENPRKSFTVAGEGCGGLGMLNCFCGGDICACEANGEIDCPGCDECLELEESDEMEEPEPAQSIPQPKPEAAAK